MDTPRLSHLVGHTVVIDWTNDPDGRRPYQHVVQAVDVEARFILLCPVDGSLVIDPEWFHLDTIARISG